MKKLSIIIFLTVAAFFSASAQTTSTATAQTGEVQRVQLINALERAQSEVKSSRTYVDALKNQVDVKTSEIKALNEKGELADAAIKGLRSEITNLRSAISEAEKALEIRKTEVETLKKDLDKTRRKLHRARTLTKYLTVAAAALAAALVLK